MATFPFKKPLSTCLPSSRVQDELPVLRGGRILYDGGIRVRRARNALRLGRFLLAHPEPVQHFALFYSFFFNESRIFHTEYFGLFLFAKRLSQLIWTLLLRILILRPGHFDDSS